MTNHDLVPFVSHTSPAMLTRAGKPAVRRLLEFFTGEYPQCEHPRRRFLPAHKERYV